MRQGPRFQQRSACQPGRGWAKGGGHQRHKLRAAGVGQGAGHLAGVRRVARAMGSRDGRGAGRSGRWQVAGQRRSMMSLIRRVCRAWSIPARRGHGREWPGPEGEAEAEAGQQVGAVLLEQGGQGYPDQWRTTARAKSWR